ncbi:MAG TPA: sodium:proton antiporter [Thermoanaerobaculia bacterium]|jgi:CPA1 family monovalent cation:H+ antiporter|nr:sodium:proton antiporter [Thermoanaerobaculia bacterium]
MAGFASLLAVLLIAVLMAALARRIGAPYPAFLALGGAVLAFVPGAPRFSVEPEIVLAIFVAPVLLDAAYDTSPRDLRDNWVAVASLALVAVGLTTAAVAWVARALVPAIPWAAAIALGAIVSPPDAAAATAVLKQLRPPHRILMILEGESLLNDASALLIYRLAVGAVAMHAFALGDVAPTLGVVLVGSVIVGLVLSWAMLWATRAICDVPTAIIIQFVGAFGVWLLADWLGLSAVLTMVTFAMSVARKAPASTPARMRVPSYAVWESAVFVLNVLAFVFIGLQIRPILESLPVDVRDHYLLVAGAVFLAVVVVRFGWVMTHNAIDRWRIRVWGFRPARPTLTPPTVRGALVVSWSGMRGIVTLAAALALPESFPYRDLIVLTSFAVVIGTLVFQGLTLKPLMRLLKMPQDELVGREVDDARRRALEAVRAALPDESSPEVRFVRHAFESQLEGSAGRATHDGGASEGHGELFRRALEAARRTTFQMRADDEIGDDAFHRLEQDLDWMEMSGG